MAAARRLALRCVAGTVGSCNVERKGGGDSCTFSVHEACSTSAITHRHHHCLLLSSGSQIRHTARRIAPYSPSHSYLHCPLASILRFFLPPSRLNSPFDPAVADMATFRVPQHPDNANVPSRTRAPAAAYDSTPAASRRPSISGDPGTASNGATAVTHPSAGTGDVSKPAVPAAAAATAGGAAAPGSALAPASKTTVVNTRPRRKRGWSRGKKICCALCLLFTAAIITVGVLIAFLVRTPDVSLNSAKVACANNDYARCITEEVDVLVYLDVDNPNIIGATINAEFGLYSEDGTYLGPGTVPDSYVDDRGVTTVTAYFTLTSAKAYPIIQQLFVEQRDVKLRAVGTVYIHVGALRPSITFEESFVIPKQDIGDVVSGLLDGVTLPSPGDVVGSIGDQIGGQIGDQIGDAIGNINLPFGTRHKAVTLARMSQLKPVNPARFRHVMLTIGEPGSEQRRQWERRHAVHQQRVSGPGRLRALIRRHNFALPPQHN